MSFYELTSQPVVRVAVSGLGNVSPTQPEEWSSSYHLSKENLVLSLVRQSVVVLKLQGNESEQLSTLHARSSTFLFDEADAVPLTPAAPSFQPLPGARHLTYQPGTKFNGALSEGIRSPAHNVFGMLDSAARLVLRAVCRSSHVRLHSSTLDTLLDEFPLHFGSVSSSKLEVQHSMSAANAAAATNGTGEISATASEEMVSNGLVTIISTATQKVDMGNGQQRQASMLQVKNREAKWINVPLGQDEVAVVLGATAFHATGGVLKPAAYRMVGEFHLGAGHRWCAFHLSARPTALLAFAPVLEEAGHFVPERFHAPISVKALVDNLQVARTAARGAASSARSSTCVLRFRPATPPTTINPTRQKRMGKKRPASEMEDDVGSLCLYDTPQDDENVPPPEAPRRSRAGRLLSRPASATGGEPLATRPPSEARAGSQHHGEVRGLNLHSALVQQSTQGGEAAPSTPARQSAAGSMIVWTCLDLHGATGNNVVQLVFVNSHGVELYFKASALLPCGGMFESYADRMGADLGAIAFMRKEGRLYGGDTPHAVGLRNFDVIQVISNRKV